MLKNIVKSCENYFIRWSISYFLPQTVHIVTVIVGFRFQQKLNSSVSLAK